MPLEEVVEHPVNAVGDYGIHYRFQYVNQNLHLYHLLSVNRIGDRGDDSDILQRTASEFNAARIEKISAADIIDVTNFWEGLS